MHFPKLVALIFLGISASAAADFITVTAAYEIDTSNITMPVNEGGTLKFKQCDDCEWETVLVNAGTRYVLNGANVPLSEFKEQLEDVDEDTVTVLHHLESNRITAVKIRL